MEIAKHRGKRKRYISEKREALAVVFLFFLSIKRPKVHFIVFHDLRFLC